VKVGDKVRTIGIAWPVRGTVIAVDPGGLRGAVLVDWGPRVRPSVWRLEDVARIPPDPNTKDGNG
jgi:hypothetical protein